MVRDHFKRVTELAIPVRAICGRWVFTDASLVAPGEDDALILTLRGKLPDPVDAVAVSYSLDSYLYTFETAVMGGSVARDGSATVLTLDLPTRVARVERRKSARVACNHLHAVKVRLQLPSGESYQCTAIDIGPRGAGLSIPAGVRLFHVGDSFPASLAFPRLGELRVKAVARAVSDTPAHSRMGIEFLDLSEEDADLVRQYVHLRQIQTRLKQEDQKAARNSGESIFVVALEDPSGIKHLVLCTDAFLSHIADSGVFTEITSVDIIDYLEKK